MAAKVRIFKIRLSVYILISFLSISRSMGFAFRRKMSFIRKMKKSKLCSKLITGFFASSGIQNKMENIAQIFKNEWSKKALILPAVKSGYRSFKNNPKYNVPDSA